VLARDVQAYLLTRVFDQALVSGKLDLKSMSTTIDREFGRRTPGTPLLRRLTSSRMPGAPSRSSTYLERLLEVILHDPRMPRWTREYEFSLDGVPARVDFYVPAAHVVIEADGRNWHTRWKNFESDRRRDNALAARGIQVLRFTYEMLTSEPMKCLEQAIATCLLRAA
jgi:very-short-patch-repair endonuclease